MITWTRARTVFAQPIARQRPPIAGRSKVQAMSAKARKPCAVQVREPTALTAQYAAAFTSGYSGW